MQVGIPVAPVSPAYSTQSRDFAKLRSILDQAEPGLIYLADHVRYGPALAAIQADRDAVVVSGSARNPLRGVVPFEGLTRELDHAAVKEKFLGIGPDTVAKFLFTSGSTGSPKAVINTQLMLTANQQARAQLWPFLATDPPVIVDWLPWSHTFGGNHSFNVVLCNGGTLYIDGGRPVPGLFDQTITNLKSIAPTVYFNVPVLADPAVRSAVRRGLENLRAEGLGTSGYATRALLLSEPPSIDQGEITDKGYLNQRAVLTARAGLATALERDADPRVIVVTERQA
jgi:feruloyl-CoA synthase